MPRRLALWLARFGLDPSALFQRARNLILRPARHELGDARAEIAMLRSELERLRPELAELRSELSALQSGLGLLQAEVATGASRMSQLGSLSALAADNLERIGTLETQAGHRASRVALLERLVAAGPAPRASLADAPLVSIVLPTRNRAGFVAEAIASVLAQQYPHWELIVVDDGSSDDTPTVLKRACVDERIRLERIGHRGPCGARNHALALARGDLVAYLDSDNTWYPGFLAAAVSALATDATLSLVYGALVSEVQQPGGDAILLADFDRTRLEACNYIDLNTIVHRRSLYHELGGFDESLQRVVDWDLLLRYTARHRAAPLPALAARYRSRDSLRITDTVPVGPSWISIRRRIDPAPVPSRPPRILYVVWHYPQLSETYVEGEIRCLRRWGAQIEVWRQVAPVSPYESAVPVHDGGLEELVRRFRPDAIHVHWLGFALAQEAQLGALGIPVTLRVHGFDTTARQMARLLDKAWLHRVYAYPSQLHMFPGPDPRICLVPAAFDTSFFQPSAEKDPRLVVRASACLPSKDIGLFFALAKRCPQHRFVFAGIACNEWEHYPQQLRELHAEMDSPAELHFDLPREQVAALIGAAGIYLHTINPPDVPFGAPIGMPISIAEAMATGAWTLVRDQPELRAYIGDAGATYASIEDARQLIEDSTRWSAQQWTSARVRASDHAFLRHADELVLRPIFEDWCQLTGRRDGAVGIDEDLARTV